VNSFDPILSDTARHTIYALRGCRRACFARKGTTL